MVKQILVCLDCHIFFGIENCEEISNENEQQKCSKCNKKLEWYSLNKT